MSNFDIEIYDTESTIGDEYAARAEEAYYRMIDGIADLIVSYGRDRVMVDVTEAVMSKFDELAKEGLLK